MQCSEDACLGANHFLSALRCAALRCAALRCAALTWRSTAEAPLPREAWRSREAARGLSTPLCIGLPGPGSCRAPSAKKHGERGHMQLGAGAEQHRAF